MFLRSIHPNHLQDGVVSVLGFRPNEADQGKLSGYDAQLIAPSAAYQHRTTVMGKQSAGIWEISAEELAAHQLPFLSDPLDDCAAHALLDFTADSPKIQKVKASMLAQLASMRGCRYAP